MTATTLPAKADAHERQRRLVTASLLLAPKKCDRQFEACHQPKRHDETTR